MFNKNNAPGESTYNLPVLDYRLLRNLSGRPLKKETLCVLIDTRSLIITGARYS